MPHMGVGGELPAGLEAPGDWSRAGTPPLFGLQVLGQPNAQGAADAQQECREQLGVELEHGGPGRRGGHDLTQCAGGLWTEASSGWPQSHLRGAGHSRGSALHQDPATRHPPVRVPRALEAPEAWAQGGRALGAGGCLGDGPSAACSRFLSKGRTGRSQLLYCRKHCQARIIFPGDATEWPSLGTSTCGAFTRWSSERASSMGPSCQRPPRQERAPTHHEGQQGGHAAGRATQQGGPALLEGCISAHPLQQQPQDGCGQAGLCGQCPPQGAALAGAEWEDGHLEAPAGPGSSTPTLMPTSSAPARPQMRGPAIL